MILNIYIRVLRPRQLLPEILLRIIIDFYFHRILFRDFDDYFRNPTTQVIIVLLLLLRRIPVDIESR